MPVTEVTKSPPSPPPPSGRPARRFGVLLLLTAALAGLLVWTLERGRPVPLPDAGAARLPCVSYAPFRRPGQAPFDPLLLVPPEQIAADLRLLATLTRCVRTYGLDHGLDAVPAIARGLGLHVVLGVWVDRDPAANRARLDRALELVRIHADVVDLLVVGNEVLLRRELAPDALAALLARAKRESAVPVAYADVWEFWLRHGQVLRGQVDVVAAHILPYWEDRPVAVADAIDHVAAIAAALGAVFDPLPVFIAETGWPAAGRQRGPAVPGRLEQARFVRELLARQATDPLPFNLIEGFDQPWKRALEGAMGGAWGLFDAQGQARVTLSGPLVADPHGWRLLVAAALGGLAGLLWAARRGRGQSRMATADRLWPALVLVLGGAGSAALLPLQWDALVLWSRGPLEWGLGALTALLALRCALAAAGRLADWPSRSGRPGLVDAARLGFLFVTAMAALGLVFDPRYRPLAWPALAAPALLWSALALLGDRRAAGAREERLLAAVCAGCAPLIAVQEGPANTQAMVYVGLLLALAVPILLPHRGAPVAGRTRVSPASSTAGAAAEVE